MKKITNITLFVIFLVCSSLLIKAQDGTGKLHPSFRTILYKSKSCLSLNKSTTGNDGTLSVIIYTLNPSSIKRKGIHLNTILPLFSTARIKKEQLGTLVDDSTVVYISPATQNYLYTDVSLPEIGVPLLHSAFLNNTPYKGDGVIIVVYDTGIDWKHLDFRKDDTTQSRILFLWDQTLTPLDNEQSPAGFNYGVEYTQEHINDELDGTPTGYVRSFDYNGHGTHVMSIAAGNGNASNKKFVGVAPNADLIVIKGGESSFDEAAMIDALTYVNQKAQQLGKSVVVNWSIGGQYGAHDGTLPYEIAVDNFSGPGRIVCIAAGNDAKFNIHTSGILSKMNPVTILLEQPPYIPSSDSMHHFFNFMLWLQGDVTVGGNSALVATIESPSQIKYTSRKDENGQALDTSDGFIYLFNYISVENNHRCIELHVAATSVVPPKTGIWKLTVTTSQIEPIQYDGWITVRAGARDIPYLALVSDGDNNKTVSMPGTAKKAITVGSYVTKWFWPSIDGQMYSYDYTTDKTGELSNFSGRGPTRDERIKPEITAPGQGVTAAVSSKSNVSTYRLHPNSHYKIDVGTSQATPIVAGSTAVLLGIQPNLTDADIKNILSLSSRSDMYATNLPNPQWGYGKIDIANSVAKLLGSNQTEIHRTVINYHSKDRASSVLLTGDKKICIRFTTTKDGIVTGCYLGVAPSADHSIVGTGNITCEIFSDLFNPQSRIATSINYPLAKLYPATMNYILLTGIGLNVEAGKSYYLVISLDKESDTLKIWRDNVTTNFNSYIFAEGQWFLIQEGNLFIDIEVTSTEGNIVKVIQNNVEEFNVTQNYPNPFNASTKIKYSIHRDGCVIAELYDVLGRKIKTLHEQRMVKGEYLLDIDGMNYSSGIYFIRFRVLSDNNEVLYNKTLKALIIK